MLPLFLCHGAINSRTTTTTRQGATTFCLWHKQGGGGVALGAAETVIGILAFSHRLVRFGGNVGVGRSFDQAEDPPLRNVWLAPTSPLLYQKQKDNFNLPNLLHLTSLPNLFLPTHNSSIDCVALGLDFECHDSWEQTILFFFDV